MLLFSLLIPLFSFGLPAWIHWFAGGYFSGRGMDAGESIYAVLVAPILETPIFFVPLARDCPCVVFATLVLLSFGFCFFESLHHQRHFYEHPLMWMTGYMFIVAYEAGRTRSLLHAIVFCTAVHEAYNLAVTLLDPSWYPNPSSSVFPLVSEDASKRRVRWLNPLRVGKGLSADHARPRSFA